jgi:hypothetical protein
VKTKNEFCNRMQVVFCCLYYRCHHYSEAMIQALIEELNPQAVRMTSNDTKRIWQSFQVLQTEIVARHMQLATFFVKHTERGQLYAQDATRRRGNKSKIPHLSSAEILEALQLSSGALRLLWMPIVPVVTGEWAVSTTTDGADLENYAAYFRNFTGGFVGIIARLYSSQKEQISTSIQVGFFSANSHLKVDREWSNWNLGSSEVQLYWNGTSLSESDRGKFNTYIAEISTIVGSSLEREDDGILADDRDSDAVRISSDLVEEANEVIARRMDFDAEFRETGGVRM